MSTDASSPSWFQRRALSVIDFYQRAAEGRPSPCRFSPSCSSYAREAFEVHGGRRGAWLTVRRLLRCRPFGSSGWDPVPEPHVSCVTDVPTEAGTPSAGSSSSVSSRTSRKDS